MRLIFIFLFCSPTFAAKIQLQCGESGQLLAVKADNLSVDLNFESKEPIPDKDQWGTVSFNGRKFELNDLARVTQFALMNGVDPYLLMGIFVNEGGSIPVDGMGVTRLLNCAARNRADIKHFAAKDIEIVQSANVRLKSLSAERSRLKGGEDLEEWQVLQKEVDKLLRANEEQKRLLKSAKGDAREAVQDQITDNDEELKGLRKEQQEYVKTPAMKSIVALELERSQIKAKLDAVRSRVASSASDDRARSEINDEWECLKSDTCVAILLPNEKPISVDLISARGVTDSTAVDSKVCLSGNTLQKDAADLSKTTGTCCASIRAPAGRKPAQELAMAASARMLKDLNCGGGGKAVSDCLSRYFEMKGTCGPKHAYQVELLIARELFAHTHVNSMVGFESKRLKKPVLSLSCLGVKKEAVDIDEAAAAQDLKKFISVHKSCG